MWFNILKYRCLTISTTNWRSFFNKKQRICSFARHGQRSNYQKDRTWDKLGPVNGERNGSVVLKRCCWSTTWRIIPVSEWLITRFDPMGWKSLSFTTLGPNIFEAPLFPSAFLQQWTSKFWISWDTLLATNISLTNALSKIIFIFPGWDMLVPLRVAGWTFWWYLPIGKMGIFPASDMAQGRARWIQT